MDAANFRVFQFATVISTYKIVELATKENVLVFYPVRRNNQIYEPSSERVFLSAIVGEFPRTFRTCRIFLLLRAASKSSEAFSTFAKNYSSKYCFKEPR